MAERNRTCAQCGAPATWNSPAGLGLCTRCAAREANLAVLPEPVGDDPDELVDLDAEFDDDPFDDLDDDEAFLREWEEAEAFAVGLLREALPEVRAAAAPYDELRASVARIREGVEAGDWPYRYLAAAAGWGGEAPADDVELWIGAAGALVAMREESGAGPDFDAQLMSLEHADWIGAVVGLVRAGVGASAEAADLVEYVDACPEVDGEIDPEDVDHVEMSFQLVLAPWEAVGALDPDHRLTGLGRWGLPRALAWAWNGDFDAPVEPESAAT